MHGTALLHPILYITLQFLSCFVLMTVKNVIPLEILRPHLGALGGSQAPVEFPAYYGMSRRHRQEKTFLFRHVVANSLCVCMHWCGVRVKENWGNDKYSSCAHKPAAGADLRMRTYTPICK